MVLSRGLLKTFGRDQYKEKKGPKCLNINCLSLTNINITCSVTKRIKTKNLAEKDYKMHAAIIRNVPLYFLL